jgi:hypothetical protein
LHLSASNAAAKLPRLRNATETLCVGEMRKRRTAKWAAPGGLALVTQQYNTINVTHPLMHDPRPFILMLNCMQHLPSSRQSRRQSRAIYLSILYLTLKHSLPIKTENI